MKKAATAVIIVILVGLGIFFAVRSVSGPGTGNTVEVTDNQVVVSQMPDPEISLEPTPTAESVGEVGADPAEAVADEADLTEAAVDEEDAARAEEDEELSEEAAEEEEPASIFSGNRALGQDEAAETIRESDDRTTIDIPEPNYYFGG